ncbi:MAG: ATP-dependent helicase RecG, partial [Chloroflexota bacterium]|nr:ATP-dependent helicase RecG [Chloroflexota bacterium]
MPRLHVVRDPSLDDPVATLAGVSDRTEARLARLGIATIRDLLLFFPRRYEDFSTITPIAFVRPGVKTTVRGRIYDIGARQTKYKRMALTEAVLGDDSGTTLRVVWFNQPWLVKSLQKGDEIFVAGEADLNGGLVMKNPDHEKVSLRPQHAAR